MSSVNKMVMLPYDRYENLLSSAEEKINLKTYANVYSQTENDISEKNSQNEKTILNQNGYGSTVENQNNLNFHSTEFKEIKQKKRKPPPGIPNKRIKWLKFS